MLKNYSLKKILKIIFYCILFIDVRKLFFLGRYQANLEKAIYKEMNEGKDRSINNSFLYIEFIIGISLCIFVGFIFMNQSIKPINTLKGIIRQISQGNIPEKVNYSDDEIGEIIKDVNTLVDNLEGVKDFSTEVGKGNFESETNVFNNAGVLGGSLAGMKDSLK